MSFFRRNNDDEHIKLDESDGIVIIQSILQDLAKSLEETISLTPNKSVVTTSKAKAELVNLLSGNGRFTIGLAALKLDLDRDFLTTLFSKVREENPGIHFILERDSIICTGEIERLGNEIAEKVKTDGFLESVELCNKELIDIVVFNKILIISEACKTSRLRSIDGICFSETSFNLEEDRIVTRLSQLEYPETIQHISSDSTIPKVSDLVIRNLLRSTTGSSGRVKRLPGILDGKGLYTPDSYIAGLKQGILSNLQIHPVHLDDFAKAGIRDIATFLESNFQSSYYILPKHVISETYLSPILTAVVESVSKGWLDSSQISFTDLADKEDQVYIIHKIINSRLSNDYSASFIGVSNSSGYFISDSLRLKISNLLESLADQEANHLSSEILESNRVLISSYIWADGLAISSDCSKLVASKSEDFSRRLKASSVDELPDVPITIVNYYVDKQKKSENWRKQATKRLMEDVKKNSTHELVRVLVNTRAIRSLEEGDARLALKIYGDFVNSEIKKGNLTNESSGLSSSELEDALVKRINEIDGVDIDKLSHENQLVQIKSLQDKLYKTKDPALILHLAVLISNAKNLESQNIAGVLSASGKYVPKLLKLLATSDSEYKDLIRLKDLIVAKAPASELTESSLKVKDLIQSYT